MRLRIPLALIGCLLASGNAFAQVERTPRPAPSSLPPTIAAEADLSNDPRLKKSMDFRVKWARVEQVTDAISKATGAAVRVDPEVAGRRCNLFTYGTPVGVDMAHLARGLGLSWRRERDGNERNVYTLFLTDEQRDRERRQEKNSERREAARMAALAERNAKALRDAIARSHEANRLDFRAYLGRFSDAQIANLGRLALQDFGIISASNQSHFIPRLAYTQPWDALPSEVRNTIRAMLNRKEYTPAAGDRQMESAAASDAELKQCRFGVVAAGGGVSLALYNPATQDVWVSPFDNVGGAASSQEEEANDFDPSVANLLEFVSRKARLPFVCDDYLLTRTTPFSELLFPASEGFTVGDALRQMARTFGHRMTYQDGILYVQTLTPGRDRRAEPPSDVMRVLASRVENRQDLSFADVLRVGTLSPLPVNTLLTYSPVSLQPVKGTLYQVQKAYPLLHLFAELSPDEQQATQGEDGLAADAVSISKRQRFHEAQGRGAPLLDPRKEYKPNRLCCERQQNAAAKSEEITLILTGDREGEAVSYHIQCALPENTSADPRATHTPSADLPTAP